MEYFKDPFKDFIDENTSKAFQGMPKKFLDRMTASTRMFINLKSDCASGTNMILACIAYMFGSPTVLQKYFTDPKWQVNSTLLVSKLNGEIIPVYVANSLKEAKDSANANYLTNFRHSEQSDWSFAIASDFLHWTLYAFDQKEKKLWAHNFDISNSSAKNIHALLSHVIVIIGHNQQNKEAARLAEYSIRTQSKESSTTTENTEKGSEPKVINITSIADAQREFMKFVESQKNNPDNLRFWK